MSFVCYICETSFTRHNNLKKHLETLKCQTFLNNDYNKLNYIFKELRELRLKKTNNEIKNHTENTSHENIINHNETINNNINNNINIKIEINPITKLQISHLNSETFKSMIYSYDDMTEKTPEKLNILLSKYAKDVLCDKNHPENHAVKYTRIRPPTFNCKVQDENGNTVCVIKGLKDTCELLTDPILNSLKQKIRLFLMKYQKDDKEDFDYGLYDTAIDKLKNEFTKQNVKKALSCVLQNDILGDIEMKFEITK